MKRSLRDFNPVKVAALDTAMWRAFYNHQFIRLATLLFRLFRTQFGSGRLRTFRIAYFSSRAAVVFRIYGNRDRALAFLVKFFKEINEISRENFNPEKAASLELEWWFVHRDPQNHPKDLARSLAETMAELYGVDPESLLDYGHARALAMHERDGKTPNWDKIREYLNDSYRALKHSVTL